jgi:hypothetical protein
MRRTSSQHAAVMAENRAAEEQAYRALYGNHRADVDLLRRRGFVVTREGEGFRVGNKVVTAAELIAVADRERRLVGADASAAAGRNAGGAQGRRQGCAGAATGENRRRTAAGSFKSRAESTRDRGWRYGCE